MWPLERFKRSSWLNYIQITHQCQDHSSTRARKNFSGRAMTSWDGACREKTGGYSWPWEQWAWLLSHRHEFQQCGTEQMTEAQLPSMVAMSWPLWGCTPHCCWSGWHKSVGNVGMAGVEHVIAMVWISVPRRFVKDLVASPWHCWERTEPLSKGTLENLPLIWGHAPGVRGGTPAPLLSLFASDKPSGELSITMRCLLLAQKDRGNANELNSQFSVKMNLPFS